MMIEKWPQYRGPHYDDRGTGNSGHSMEGHIMMTQKQATIATL